MKLLTTLLSASVLLAPGVSTLPLNERGILQIRAPPTSQQKTQQKAKQKVADYDIDRVISKWFQNNNVQETFPYLRDTVGGWEGWAQVELEREFKTNLDLDSFDIREQSKVFENSNFADFVLPARGGHSGMIVEVKCENKITNKGKAMVSKAQGDEAKADHIKAEYDDYNFVVLAMAYSKDAQKALSSLGLKEVPKAQHIIEEDVAVMKVYKKEIPLPTPGGAAQRKAREQEMDKLAADLLKIGITDDPPASRGGKGRGSSSGTTTPSGTDDTAPNTRGGRGRGSATGATDTTAPGSTDNTAPGTRGGRGRGSTTSSPTDNTGPGTRSGRGRGGRGRGTTQGTTTDNST